MIYDAHIHIYPSLYGGPFDTPAQFLEKARSAGVVGGAVFSLPPKGALEYYDSEQPENEERMRHVLDCCSRLPDTFYPFYRLNPTEPDAPAQVVRAAELGIRGFKVLCSDYDPADGMAAYRQCAEVRLPVTFHSGILWDGKVSSAYNRPLSFECLLSVPGLRFCLAHMSWPWISECIALFGKFNDTQRCYGNAPEMYIDTSPGSPEFDREEAFRKMGLLCYGMEDRLMFGSDNCLNRYNADFARDTYEFDREKFDHLHEIYSDPARLRKDLRFLRRGRETIDFKEFFKKATERNFLSYIRKD